jgi:hypothetical protein
MIFHQVIQPGMSRMRIPVGVRQVMPRLRPRLLYRIVLGIGGSDAGRVHATPKAVAPLRTDKGRDQPVLDDGFSLWL